MRKIFFTLLFTLLFVSIPSAHAACTPSGTTLTAASAQETDVKACLTAATSTTTQINIPAGNANWNTPLTFTVPTGNNNLTIAGATVCTPSGTPGTAGYTVSCVDNTSITDGITSSSTAELFVISGVNNTTLFRITGLTVTTGRLQYSGMISVNGTSPNYRFDNNHIVLTTSQSGLSMMRVNGCINGVADHNLLVMAVNTGNLNGIQEYNGASCFSDSLGLGDQVWAHSTALGASNFFFLEANEVQNGAMNDCLFGGRFVIRYNTIFNTPTAPPIQTHATSGGRQRGCRAWEIYDNYVVNTSATEAFEAFRLESGTGVVWGNTVPNSNGGFGNLLNFHSERSSNYTYMETAPPGGWGYCGTASGLPGAGVNWDQNTNTSDGHECMDAVGMGIGDLLVGGFTSDSSGSNNVQNSATGAFYNSAGAWPRQALEPMHEWLDTMTPASGGNYFGVNDPTTTAIVNNREFYVWCNASSNSGCTSFTGAAGTGSGLLSARPSTCTTNVAYWETDNLQLDYCNSTNTWSTLASSPASYKPYTYPHPLTTGGSALPPSGSPTSGVVPQTVTVTNPNSGTTDVCYAASPTVPSTNGAGTGCNTGTEYTTPISVVSAQTLNLIAGTSTQADSSVVSYTYTASPVAPTVTTTAATSITSTGATSGGSVTATGGASVTSEGVCYGLSANPTTPCTSNGTASPFTSPITGLTPSTTYNYRAFATNSAGTGYGSNSTFTTLSTCQNPVAIGAFTACNFSYTDVNTGTSASVNMSPFAGNGIEIIFQYCGNSSCNPAPTQTLVSVSDNVNSPETCFVQAPHSPYAYANTNVPDYETLYALYCPSIPAGVTSFTVTINATANYLQPDVVEWKAGTIASTGYFENVDNEANAGPVAGTTATVPTNGATVHASDLITAMIANCGASIPATVGTGYTGLIVNPTATPGHIFEAMAVTTTGTKTATTTWSTGSASSSCALGTGGSNDTWFGVIVPLVGAVTLTPASENFGSINVGSSSSSVTFTLTNGSNTTATSITPITIGGNSGDFTIANSGAGSCSAAGNSIAASASCTVKVTFSPTASGSRSTTLSISYSGGDGEAPQISSLSGTGVASAVVGSNMSGGIQILSGAKVQ